jgi:Concanavalin A-like lectin/glucanases superfamily
MGLILNSGFTVGPGVILNSGYNTIVTSDLQLYLDAGNPNSYPGSGSTWTDLIAGKQFTLYNGATFNPVSTHPGYFNFNGSGQYAYTTSNLNLNTFTVQSWFRPTAVNTQAGAAIISSAYNGNYVNFALGFDDGTIVSSDANQIIGGWYGNGWRGVAGFTPTLNSWYNAAVSYDGAALKFYTNGVLTATAAASGTNQTDNLGIYVGHRWDGSQSYTGDISVIQVYNRALSSDEILNNFNAERARFGL